MRNFADIHNINEKNRLHKIIMQFPGWELMMIEEV